MVAVVARPPAARTACLHCGLPVVPAGAGRHGDFCCSGCEAVYGLLHREHLGRYYALRGARGVPALASAGVRRDTKWLELLEARLAAAGGHARLALDLQGLHCVGCVWLIEELFAREPGTSRILVNPALGRVDLWVSRDFALRRFVEHVEAFGYRFGPPLKRAPAASRDLVVRLGVCAAIAMNSMIFGIAMYAGLRAGPLFSLFTALNFVLGSLSVAVGGSVFFRSALRGARRGVLHLDLPIALGIALAFAGSTLSYATHRSESSYFDTLDVFIALMLLGRWLQERVLEHNRAWLLASDGAEGLLARRVEGGRVRLVSCAELREGDALLVAPGDLVPTDARLDGDASTFSLDWISGESRPRTYRPGDVVPAGAFATGPNAAALEVVVPFESSPLRDLLRQPERPRSGGDAEGERSSPWWQALSRVYVTAVLALAAASFAGWWAGTHDLAVALRVTTAVLIVTCPCAFGIAAPLAYEMAQAGLRRHGLFVRRAGFLDRAARVRRVVFDKTGTLTTGVLALSDETPLAALDRRALAALYDLVARSSHPKSAAIREALAPYDLSVTPGARVVEHPGKGIELSDACGCFRLGAPAWAAAAASHGSGDVAFSRDGHLLASFTTAERLRPDAAHEVRALEDDGHEIWLLSGDAQHRVDAVGAASGIDPRRSIGGCSPRDKARFFEDPAHGDALFVGDGVNDALALDRALVSGTPAVDRPFVPARADFFFVTPGLAPLRLAIRTSRAVAQVVRADLAIALAYNAITVGLAVGGRMSPLACAVLMPLSSLTTIAATVFALSRRSRLWKS
jgi:Cu2+-exporting ATPase